MYGCGPLCVLSGDGSGLPGPGRPDTPRTHIASTKAWSWLKGLRQAVVDRHKGGELASLAGDTLQEAIEAASRVSVGFAARRICLWRPSRRTGPGLGTHMASVRAALSTKRSGQAGRGRWTLWTTAPPLGRVSSKASFFEPLFHRLLRQPSATLKWETRRMEGQKQHRDQQQRGRDAPLPGRPPSYGGGTASSQSSFVDVLGCDGPPAT